MSTPANEIAPFRDVGPPLNWHRKTCVLLKRQPTRAMGHSHQRRLGAKVATDHSSRFRVTCSEKLRHATTGRTAEMRRALLGEMQIRCAAFID
jgi:hypothetical protein